MKPADLQAFCTDKNLYELIELSRSSDDLLSMIRPRETQRADLLAWAMDAGEGHGQSDVVFRNFLLEVFRSASGENPGDRLYKTSASWHFVQHWTPARVLAADFGSVVCYREYTMKDGRPDFLIVDPANQLVIVVEIKSGAAFGKGQLEKYRNSAHKEVLNRAAFRDYKKAFVAIDSNLDPTDLPKGFDTHWVAMDYAWFSHIERHAQYAVKRGDRGAALLLSFCRVLTEYEAPEDQRLNQLAGELCIQHPAVVAELKVARDNAESVGSWTNRLLSGNDESQQLFRLYVQHQRALNRLVGLSHMRLLRAKLSEAFPLLEAHADLKDSGQVWFQRAMPLEPERQPPLQAGYWPLVLRLRHRNRRAQNQRPSFRISLHWWASPFGPDSPMEKIAALLEKEFGKKGLRKPRVNWTTLHEELCVDVKEATEKTTALIQRVERLARPQ